MRILFIGKRFYTNRDALSEQYGRIYQLPHRWSRHGAAVQLWLIDYKWRTSRSESKTGDDTFPVLCTRVFDWGMFRQIVRLFVSRRSERPGIIVASGDCYIGLLAWIVARTLKARFVFDIYDRYDEFPGYLHTPGFDLLTFLRERADACLFASELVPTQLGGRKPSDIIVPNGVDTQHFKPLDKLHCRRTLGIGEDDRIVGYFGGMEPDRGVDDLVKAIELLVSDGLDVRLLLAGKSQNVERFRRPFIHYLGDVPYRQMPTLLGCCDVLALPYRRSTFMDAGASNKISEYIAVGRPIAATRTPNLLANFEHDDEFEAHTAEPGDPESLAEVLSESLRSPRMLTLPAGVTWPEISRSTLARLRKQLGDSPE